MGVNNIRVDIHQPLGIGLQLLGLTVIGQHLEIDIASGLLHIEEYIVDTRHRGLEGLGSIADGLLTQGPTREKEHDEERHDKQDSQSGNHHQTEFGGKGMAYMAGES